MPVIPKVLNLQVQVGALPPVAKVHSKEAGFWKARNQAPLVNSLAQHREWCFEHRRVTYKDLVFQLQAFRSISGTGLAGQRSYASA